MMITGMKNKKKTILILTVFTFFAVNTVVFSQETSEELNAIQTVVPFLTIAPDSRSGGMGDAGVATTPDVFSMHWNPAKFAFIDGNGGAGLSYAPWLRNLVPDINIAYLTGYKRIDSKQVLSASLLYNSYGLVSLTDDFGNHERDINPNEFSVDAGYARLFTENLSGGIAFRFIYSNITGGAYSGGEATKPGISFAADISGYYQKEIALGNKDGMWAMGLNFSNIGSKMSYTDSQTSDFIPMNLRLGTSGSIELDAYNSLTLTVDINKLLVPTPPIYNSDMEIIDGKSLQFSNTDFPVCPGTGQ